MLATAKSGSVIGVNAFLIEVEVDVSAGLPGFNIVGLPEGAVRESRERVRAAIKNCGYPFPTRKITVNLAPADMKKEGTGLDLPIAAAILCAAGVIPQERLAAFAMLGELSLDGNIRPTRGILPLSLAAGSWGLSGGLIVPEENAPEAAVVKETRVYPVKHLSGMAEFLLGNLAIAAVKVDHDSLFSSGGGCHDDFSDVIGQEHAKRALEVAAAGGHNVLMAGPPGSGKTMLARRLPSILPPLSFEEALETTAVYSVAGLMPPGRPLMLERPFCAPHHSISDAGLIGGGATPRPGQVSLAHNGVLFLDELPEFQKNVLESLRQPLEDGVVTIARVNMALTFPARVTLVAAQNPCPCGHLGDARKNCSCTPQQIVRYKSRVSGPLLDRIDMHIDVPAVPYPELSKSRQGDSSKIIRDRVVAARNIQKVRFAGLPIHCNSQMSARQMKSFCRLDGQCRDFIGGAIQKLGLSARAYHRIVKIARTIADLEGAAEVLISHMAEAVQYRGLDRNLTAR